MHKFECNPGMEVSGNLALALLLNFEAEDFKPIVARYGLANVDPDQWYPFQNLLNVFKDISSKSNAMFDFVAVGMAAADRYTLPPELANLTLEQFFLKAMPGLINRSYRNGEATRIIVEKVGDRHLLIRLDSAQPDDATYGFMYSFARRFLKGQGSLTLQYDETQPRQDFGGDETRIHLTW